MPVTRNYFPTLYFVSHGFKSYCTKTSSNMSTGKSQGYHRLPFQIDLCRIKGCSASVILPTALLSKPKTGIFHIFFSHLVMSILSPRRQKRHAFLSILTTTAQLVPLPLKLLQFSSSVSLFCLYNPPSRLPR